MIWGALIVAGAAFVVLVVVAASGIGPVSSLLRTLRRFGELSEEAERLRRAADRLAQSAERLGDEP